MGDDVPILGGFQLREPLAEGGMGQVWRARHHTRPVDAAVKVLASEASDDTAAQVLLAELHSVARLAHPNIVAVYDAGRVDDDAAAVSGGRLEPGRPWYAMELVDGDRLRQGSWPEIRRWLLQLLDALGHAHARGVVHRDLKPSNVLVDDAGDVRLVDFGMAFTSDESEATRSSAANPLDGGTPTWMAPEQFSAPRALHGPWTDLYAVGMLTWALTCGHAPHQARSTWRLMHLHLNAPLPPLQPTIDVPRGLEAWIRRCAAKSPADRYPRAIDAARALQALGAPVGSRTVRKAPIVDTDTPTVRAVHLPKPGLRVWQPAPAEPVPPTWRDVQTSPRPVDPSVLGLGLTRLRELPLSGRDEERDRLWEALRDAAVGPRVVTLEGDAGVGKTALARWLCRSVHELGLGQPVRVSGDPHLPDAPRAVIQRTLAVGSESDADLVEILEARLGTDLAAGVHPLLRPREGEPALPHDQAVHLAVRVVRRLAGRRLPVLWVDDAQWSGTGVALARTLLDGGGPCLVVLTVRRDAVDDDPDVALDLDRLRERGDALDVGPLSPRAIRALLHSVGGIAPELADTLVQRTGCNPLFVLELVSDWEERGLLEVTDDGWVLREGAFVPLPPALSDLWTDRVDQLLARDPSWEGPLELAAALGGTVVGSEWSEACAQARLSIPSDLVPRMVAAGLAIQDPGSRGLAWRLSHSMLREALVERAEHAGRLPEWDRAAARMLDRRGRRVADRRARHLERAGELSEAVDAWLRAAAWLQEVDQRRATRATARAAALLEQLPDDDPRRDRLAYTRARSMAFRGDRDEARALAEALVERGRRRDDPDTEGRGWMVLSMLYRLSWDAPAAVETAEHALRCMQRVEVPENRIAEAWAELGFAQFARGRFDQADESFRQSGMHAFIPAMKVQADLLRAHTQMQLGDVRRAQERLDRAAERIDPESALMRYTVDLLAAELAHARGETDAALAHVRQSIALCEARFRVPNSRTVGLLIEVLLDAGQTDEARATLETWDAPDRTSALEWVTVEAMVAATEGERERLDHALSRVEADESTQAVISIARRLERTADRALSVDRDLTARAARLAVDAWERAHRPADADRVRAALWASGLGPDPGTG